MSKSNALKFFPKRAVYSVCSVVPILLASPVQAVEFKVPDSDFAGSIDTTVSYGQLWRVQGQATYADDINANDGNRNFETGLVSEVYKITSDVEATYKNYGLFVRGTAFYDTQIMDKRNAFNDSSNPSQPSQTYPKNNRFTSETRDKAGHDAQILDAYVYGSWDIAGAPVTARLGKQVFNWGEGIFYRGGVNTTNPIDASKFRLPGSELKEVLIPIEAFNFSVGLTDNLSMETFYQFNFKETAVDPSGTYFADTDVFADGGHTAYTISSALAPAVSAYNTLAAGGFGSAAQLNAAKAAGLYQGVGGQNFGQGNILRVASRQGDDNARDDGQWGVSFKYIAEALNSTEFGVYFVNYHAKEPTVNSDLNGYKGINVAQLAGALGGAFGGPPLCAGLACGTAAGGMATVDLLGNVVARRAYAEDIRMLGLSFNTTVNEVSIFGELAYRPNNPIGIAATDDLVGDLGQQAAQLADTSGITGPNAGTAILAGQFGGRDLVIHNSVRVETFNTSLGAIKNFGPALTFDSLIGVAELASEHYRADSLKYTAYDGSVRYYSGRQNISYILGGNSDQITRDAYGYTLLLNGTWNDVYAGVNLSPYVVYKNDFRGNSSQTGNFVEGRQAYTVGMRASYLTNLEAELAYTNFWGGGIDNGSRDRDNIGLNVKYSF
jgi:hypothetical protein